MAGTAVVSADTRLVADIQSRAGSLTWEEGWIGDGMQLFIAQILVREAVGEEAAARSWLCATYLSLEERAAGNPALATGGDPQQDAAWGALWWNGLRHELSDVGLRDLLHVLTTRLGTSPASLEDILAAADDVMRRDMKPNFEPWLNARLIGETPAAALCGDERGK